MHDIATADVIPRRDERPAWLNFRREFYWIAFVSAVEEISRVLTGVEDVENLIEFGVRP